ncbi:hypothetical protein [Terrarubrum flagellatum]|uniref:hypothetical protein n=1 Tax=Terrirubrum flagellatum TaxID=2895980 RepID=UPI00314508A6
MTPTALLLLAGDVLCCTGRQMAFTAATRAASKGEGGHWAELARSPFLWLGVALFLGEALFWLAFVSLVPLSTAVMVGCVNIATVMLSGRILFGDRIDPVRAVAIGLIGFGVVLVGWGAA